MTSERWRELDEFAERLARRYDPRFGTYAGGADRPDEYVRRLSDALTRNDEDGIEHVAALMLVLLYRREGAIPADLMADWERLFVGA